MSSEKDKPESSVASDGSPVMTGEGAVVVFHHAVETVTSADGRRVVVCSHCGKEFSESSGKALNDELTNPMHDCVSTHFAATVPAEKREKFLGRLHG
jgi:hypothetical protein